MDAHRRRFIATAPLVVASPALLSGCAATVKTFPSLAEGVKAIEALTAKSRSTGAWSLPEVLNHLAQSVEYSVGPVGFPRPRSKWFQYSAGLGAFLLFSARGEMSHALDEAIPGAPPIGGTFSVAKARLLAALKDFEAHHGEHKPNFVYGKLSREQYTRAHLMHLANHWTEIVVA
jgi:Protein of unknown function (DUF1569)